LILGGTSAEGLRLEFVDRRLRESLNAAGYAESSYYVIPNGFAVVTRLEQIEPNGRPRAGQSRWSVELTRVYPFSLGAYLRALFTADPGYYRVIALLVTDQPFSQSQERLTRERAIEMALGGLNTLPAGIAGQPYTTAVQCTALIYEFELQRTSDSKPATRLLLPSRLDARTHLAGSGLLAALNLNQAR
jgi:hypothetical protein